MRPLRPKVPSEHYVLEFPSGTYFIGDPRHAFPAKESYEEFQEETKQGMMFKGRPTYVDFTAVGDGLYFGAYSLQYEVVSGCIGMIPLHVICDDGLIGIRRRGKVITSDYPITVEYDDGVFTFRNMIGLIERIDTNPRNWSRCEDEDF